MKKQFIITTLILVSAYVHSRSVHRPPERLIPTISVESISGGQIYTVKDSRLEEYPHFGFDITQLKEDLLPKQTNITYRNDTKSSVSGIDFNNMLEHLLIELLNRKKAFRDFKVLQKKNYNFHHTCGLIVLKCKKHPFVVKLFIEQPNTYLYPSIKGIEPIAFYSLGGGANRHLSGLTRIKNLKYLRSKLDNHPRWQGYVKFPRKWFWLPNDPRWMRLTGKNIGGKKQIKTKLPGIYAIIADEMDINHSLDMPTQEKKKVVMNLCNDVDIYMDPHYANFVFSPHQDKTKPFKIVIVDTEHFPTIVGFKKKIHFRNHNSWYQYLFGKYLGDVFFRTKKVRIAEQTKKRELALP